MQSSYLKQVGMYVYRKLPQIFNANLSINIYLIIVLYSHLFQKFKKSPELGSIFLIMFYHSIFMRSCLHGSFYTQTNALFSKNKRIITAIIFLIKTKILFFFQTTYLVSYFLNNDWLTKPVKKQLVSESAISINIFHNLEIIEV